MAISKSSYDPVQIITLEAGEALEAFRFVEADGTYTSAGEFPFAATMFSWESGDKASFITLGTILIETSEDVYTGDDIVVTTDGKAGVYSGTETKVGKALNDAATGETVKVLLR